MMTFIVCMMVSFWGSSWRARVGPASLTPTPALLKLTQKLTFIQLVCLILELWVTLLDEWCPAAGRIATAEKKMQKSYTRRPREKPSYY